MYLNLYALHLVTIMIMIIIIIIIMNIITFT